MNESPASVAFRAGSLLSEVSHRWWAVLGGSLEHRSNCVDSCGFDAGSAMFNGWSVKISGCQAFEPLKLGGVR